MRTSGWNAEPDCLEQGIDGHMPGPRGQRTPESDGER